MNINTALAKDLEPGEVILIGTGIITHATVLSVKPVPGLSDFVEITTDEGNKGVRHYHVDARMIVIVLKD